MAWGDDLICRCDGVSAADDCGKCLAAEDETMFGESPELRREIGASEDTQHPDGCGCPACQPAVRRPEAKKKTRLKVVRHAVGCGCDECQLKRRRVFLDVKSLRPSRRRRRERTRPIGRTRRSGM